MFYFQDIQYRNRVSLSNIGRGLDIFSGSFNWMCAKAIFIYIMQRSHVSIQYQIQKYHIQKDIIKRKEDLRYIIYETLIKIGSEFMVLRCYRGRKQVNAHLLQRFFKKNYSHRTVSIKHCQKLWKTASSVDREHCFLEPVNS